MTVGANNASSNTTTTRWNPGVSCSSPRESFPPSPYLLNPKSVDVRVVLDANEEEVWFIDDSAVTEPATVGPASDATGPRKRKLSDISVPSATASPDDFLDSVDAFDEGAADGDDEDALMMQSVWSALRPYKYTAYRRQRRHMMRMAQVPKHDLRREYLTMFCRVINSQDPMLLRRFFRQYCLPTLDFHRICVDGTCFTRDGVSHALKYQGATMEKMAQLLQRFFLADAFALWAVKFDLNPDHCCDIRNVRIISQRTSGAVRLEGDFCIRKTEIYDVSSERLRYLWLQKVLSGYYAGESYDEYDVLLHSERSLNHCLGELGTASPLMRHGGLYPLSLSATPRLFTIDGRIVVSIDANRRMESILLYPTSLEVLPGQHAVVGS
eukprot:gene4705-3369_t